MPNVAPNVTKQNVTELLYKASLINNTDLQVSEALTNLIIGVVELNIFSSTAAIQTEVNLGNITLDTYVAVNSPAFAPRNFFVDTAGRILAQY